MTDSNNPIDPRENADTAAEIQADSKALDDLGENTMNTVTEPAENGHPVTITIFRYDGTPYFAHYDAHGGSFAYEGQLTRPASSGSNWRGTIRATFAPRDRREAENPEGRRAIQPAIMEAVFYGNFHEAHAMMVAAIAEVSRRRERRAEKSRRRRAAKAAQNAPAPVDAANTPADTDDTL
jgi:hypothetical protein